MKEPAQAAINGDIDTTPPTGARAPAAIKATIAHAPAAKVLGAGRQSAVALKPTIASSHAYLGLYLLESGDSAAALKEFDEETDEDWRGVSRPLALDALGRREESHRESAEVDIRDANSSAYLIGLIYAWRNDRELAFHWLDQAYRQHGDGLVDMRVDACVKRLADDPRYAALLARLPLPG